MIVIDDKGTGKHSDAIPAGVSFEMLSLKQAEEAVEAGRRVFTLSLARFDGVRG